MSIPIYHLLDDSVVKRFWAKVSVGQKNDCWLWAGMRSERGYGKLKINKSVFIASRVALTLKLGEDIPQDMMACHTCDNPPCVNPEHLFPGTSKDNMQDAAAKGRTYKWDGRRAGELNPRAKLTARDVDNIRKLNGTFSRREIGKMFGVSHSHVTEIINRDTWTS